MASYTDKTPTFNPYIQQQPVEAMLKVGMEKQERYDKGVQSIQANIDNVAGLSVLRDVDKNYLQSKLNQLTSDLKGVAAGDFSNNQLVTSVNGMTNNLVKDPFIRAAVQSAAFDSKELKFQEEEEKKGNANPANTANYALKREAYLNAGLTDSKGKPITFSSSYVPYFNVDKFAKETFDALKPDGWTEDMIYQTDEQGNKLVRSYVDSKTGQVRKEYVLSETMIRLEKEGLFPAKVKEVINHIFSDPRVQQQLQISGEYNMKGYTPEMLAESIMHNKNEAISSIDNGLSLLNIKLNTATTDEEKELIQREIDKYTDGKVKIELQYEKLIKSSYENPDYVRGYLYKNQERSSYESMYTNTKEKRTVHDNPAAKFKFEMQKEANRLAMHKETVALSREKMLQDDNHFNARLRADYSIAAMKAGVDGNNTTPTPVDNQSNYDFYTQAVTEYEQSATTYSDATNKVLFEAGVFGKDPKKVLADYKAKFPGLSDETAMANIIASTAKSRGVSEEEFITKWYDESMKELSKDPKNISVTNKILKENAERATQTYMAQKARIDKINAEAPFNSSLIEGLETLTVPGLNIQITPEMQYLLAVAEAGKKPFAASSISLEGKRAEDALKQIGITDEIFNKITTYIGNKVHNPAPSTSGILYNQSFLMDMITGSNPSDNSYKKLLTKINEGNVGDVGFLEKRTALAKKLFNLDPNLQNDILTGNTEKDKVIRSGIATLVTGYIDSQQNESANFIDNAGGMLNILNNPDKGRFKMTSHKNNTTGEVTPIIQFYKVNGDHAGDMTISLEEAARYAKTDVQSWYTRPEVKTAEFLMETFQNGTTSLNPNIEDPKSYYSQGSSIYNKHNFKLLSEYAPNELDVKGNVKKVQEISSGGQVSDVYLNYLYVNFEGEKFVYTLRKKSPTMDQALQVFDSIDPQMLHTLVSQYKASKSKTK